MDVSLQIALTADLMTGPVISLSLSHTLHLYTGQPLHSDHVKHDTNPYVCETCGTPDALYDYSEDRLQHMRQHNLRWRCVAKSNGILVF